MFKIFAETYTISGAGRQRAAGWRLLFGIIVLSLIACISVTAADYSFYASSADAPYPLVNDAPVKSVILFIGDGMGINQLAAASIAACGAAGYTHIERLPVVGLLKTHAIDGLVTDSAASATALATGRKTRNGMISVCPEGKKLPTILEGARNKGLSTGLVATYSLTHATPASFAAHVESRGDESTIAIHLIENQVDVLLGGGKSYYLPQSTEGSKRPDERNLLQEAKSVGYQFVETKEGMDAIQSGKILGLFQLGTLTTVPPEPSLADMTAKAIQLLNKNENGFFLMVEGSLIDPYCHGNDAENAIRQTLLMDQAVKVAMDFAREHNDVLVLVTNDHETGGMSINGGSMDGKSLDIKWTSKGHTASPAPVYAYGPHALRFTGVRDNTDLAKIVAELLGVSSYLDAGK